MNHNHRGKVLFFTVKVKVRVRVRVRFRLYYCYDVSVLCVHMKQYQLVTVKCQFSSTLFLLSFLIMNGSRLFQPLKAFFQPPN